MSVCPAGEMLVGASTVLFMDEISTGLDSSTTHQIIKYLRHSTQALNGTTVISLLQPDPETYELFDDIILLAEGQIVYQGPSKAALEFFELMGFQCPDRKNVADFLQEVSIYLEFAIELALYEFVLIFLSFPSLNAYTQVISEKDQEQYWSFPDRHYQYVPVAKLAEAFRSFHARKSLFQLLAVPIDGCCSHPAALSTFTYGVKRAELLKMSFSWQMLLMKRNSFIYIFKFTQVILLSSFFIILRNLQSMHRYHLP